MFVHFAPFKGALCCLASLEITQNNDALLRLERKHHKCFKAKRRKLSNKWGDWQPCLGKIRTPGAPVLCQGGSPAQDQKVGLIYDENGLCLRTGHKMAL